MKTPDWPRTPETAPDRVPNGWDTYNSHEVINSAIRSHLNMRDEVIRASVNRAKEKTR